MQSAGQKLRSMLKKLTERHLHVPNKLGSRWKQDGPSLPTAHQVGRGMHALHSRLQVLTLGMPTIWKCYLLLGAISPGKADSGRAKAEEKNSKLKTEKSQLRAVTEQG